MKYQEIHYQKLSYWMQYYDDTINGIPTTGGIYYWVYWPQFKPDKINILDLEKLLLNYTKKSLSFSENLRGRYKYEAVINELNYPDNGNIFGLSESNRIRLVDYLNDKDNIKSFSNFLKNFVLVNLFMLEKRII